MKLEAGLARCLYKPANTKDHRQPTEAGRGSTTIVPWSPGREPGPADTWALDFWDFSRDCGRVNFWGLQFGIFGFLLIVWHVGY